MADPSAKALTPTPSVYRGGLPPKPAITLAPPAQKPKLLDQVRHAIRIRHYSPRTEETYVHWIKRFIFFHNKRHPAEISLFVRESCITRSNRLSRSSGLRDPRTIRAFRTNQTD
jgi:hypothetical protein